MPAALALLYASVGNVKGKLCGCAALDIPALRLARLAKAGGLGVAAAGRRSDAAGAGASGSETLPQIVTKDLQVVNIQFTSVTEILLSSRFRSCIISVTKVQGGAI